MDCPKHTFSSFELSHVSTKPSRVLPRQPAGRSHPASDGPRLLRQVSRDWSEGQKYWLMADLFKRLGSLAQERSMLIYL